MLKEQKTLHVFQKDIEYDETYIKIVNILSKEFSLSFDAVHGYNYNTVGNDLTNVIAKNTFLSFVTLLVLPIILLFALFKRNSTIDKQSDIVLEEWRDDVYKKYYIYISNNLSNKYKISRLLYEKRAFNVIDSDDKIFRILKINDYIDKKSLLKIAKVCIMNWKLLFLLWKLTSKFNLNMFYVYTKFLLVYIKYNSVATLSNTKIYLSAYDLNSHILKHEIFIKHNTKFILMQTSMRIQKDLMYKGGDRIFSYGDNQAALYKHFTNRFNNVDCVGSIINAPYVNNHVEKRYDILFVEQLADYTAIQHASNKSYKTLLSNLIRFSHEFPEYKILYRTRERRESNLISSIYSDIFEDLNNSNIIIDIIGNSYEKVISSKMVVGYYSTLCFESIGLNVPVLFCYYDDYDFELFEFKKSSSDILLRDSSYMLFQESVLNMLNNAENNTYFNKYKSIYMNQNEDIISAIGEKIKIHLQELAVL